MSTIQRCRATSNQSAEQTKTPINALSIHTRIHMYIGVKAMCQVSTLDTQACEVAVSMTLRCRLCQQCSLFQSSIGYCPTVKIPGRVSTRQPCFRSKMSDGKGAQKGEL